MRERRNTICEGNESFNPCQNKIFPFLFKPKIHQNPYSIQSICLENSSSIHKNSHNLTAKDNTKITLSSNISSKSHKRYSSFTRATLKNNLSINDSNSVKETTQNYQTERNSERSDFTESKLIYFQSLIKENSDLLNEFSRLQNEISAEEDKLEKSNQNYVEFVGSRNERNNERVRELASRIEERIREEKKKEKTDKQNMWMQLENMQLSRKSVRTSRKNKDRLY